MKDSIDYKKIWNELHEEHVVIDDLVKKVHNEDTDQEVILKHLDDLDFNVMTHFRNEEKFMEDIKYPASAYHKAIHCTLEELLHKIVLCSHLCILDKNTLVEALKKVIMNHVSTHDYMLDTYVYANFTFAEKKKVYG